MMTNHLQAVTLGADVSHREIKREKDDIAFLGGWCSIEWTLGVHRERNEIRTDSVYGMIVEYIDVVDYVDLDAFEWYDDSGFSVRWESSDIANWGPRGVLWIERILGLLPRDELEDLS